jgi:threonylcarbamoyladenosine tRNA methylthiotransferase MtaB
MGCRLNAFEAEVMRAHAAAAGLGGRSAGETAAADGAGVETVLVNTCAVTSQAVRQARQTIRRLARERPGARIVVTGCAAQVEPEGFAALPGVTDVIGNAEKRDPATYRALAAGGGASGAPANVAVGDMMAVRETAGHLIAGFGTRARAIVEVQNGCDHRCTFCIIPYGRGPSRSVPAGAVVEQVRRLVEAGFAEVVLTGVDMTSYGADLPGAPRLGRLVRQVLRHVPELPRLRLSSIDQIEADDDLVRALAEEPRLMPHLHLSLQAGDDMILKRMKRRHTRADAIAFAARVRALRPDVVFGADLIAGFPTETEEMFQGSLDLVEACGLTWLHVFPYSPRRGTPAARMPQVPTATVTARATRLRDAGDRAVAAHLSSEVGRTTTVVVEAAAMGRTPQYAEVAIPPGARHGSLLEVRVTGVVRGADGAVRQLSGTPP